ncbi:MAG TPA: permease-like cell division protein FtsX [Candidatus Limnocylindrales bacterium]|nr:permease-like cell division protein FtsX [Candidatus Limnocylindrales bacterium]
MEYYFRRALDGIKASPVASGVALASIAASVLFAGSVLLVTSNAYRAVARWAASGIDVSVYLKPDAGEADIVATKTRIQETPEVVDLRFISQEEAWQFLSQNMDHSAELLAGLSPQLLPASLEIRLDRTLTDAAVSALIEAWRTLPGVSDIQSSRASVVTGTTAADIVRWVAWALGALTLATSLLIVLTAFQLAAYTRRDEMNVLRLVGAVGRGYWGPVVLAGIFEGVVASVGAIAVLLLVFEAVAIPIRSSLPSFADRVAFLGMSQCATLVLWGAVLGGAGSAVGMRRVSEWR